MDNVSESLLTSSETSGGRSEITTIRAMEYCEILSIKSVSVWWDITTEAHHRPLIEVNTKNSDFSTLPEAHVCLRCISPHTVVRERLTHK